MLKKLFSHTLIYAIGPKIPLFGSVLLLPILTKDLTTEDFGMRGLILAVTEILLGLKLLGMEDILVQVFYKEKKEFKYIWQKVFGLLQLYLIPYSLFCGTAIFIFVPFQSTETSYFAVFLVSTTILLSLPAVFCVRLFQLQKKPLKISLISIILGCLGLIVSYVTISIFKLGFLGWYISSFATGVVGFCLYLFLLWKNGIFPQFSLNIHPVKVHFKNGFPLIPNKYGHYLLNSSDKMIMGLLGLNVNNIGTYVAGYSIGQKVGLFKNAISFGIMPFIFELISKNKKDETSPKLIQVVAGLFLSFTFIIGIWSKEISDLLMSNSELKQIYPIVLIVVMSQNYAPLRFYYTAFMINENRQKVFWKITLFAGIINVVINLLFLYQFGVIVAAISTFISYIFMTWFGYKINYYKEVKTQDINVTNWMITITVMTIIAYTIMEISILAKSLITLVVIILVMILFFYLKRTWMPKNLF